MCQNEDLKIVETVAGDPELVSDEDSVLFEHFLHQLLPPSQPCLPVSESLALIKERIPLPDHKQIA